MRRWTIRVLVWLALGATVNVAVAWSALAWRTVKLVPVAGVAFSWPEPGYAGAGWPTCGGMNATSNAVCSSVAAFGESSKVSTRDRSASAGHFRMVSVAAGWPLRSLRCISTDDPLSGHKSREGIELPASWRAHQSKFWSVPTHPLAAGFVLNSAFYATAIAAGSICESMLRRRYPESTFIWKRRLRSSGTWLGLLCVLLLAVLAVLSVWISIWLNSGGLTVALEGGQISTSFVNLGMPAGSQWHAESRANPTMDWSFTYEDSPIGYSVRLPLWPVVLLVSIVTALLWYCGRRSTRAGHCQRCKYDLTGLAPGGKCPECGKGSVISSPVPEKS